MQSAALLLLLLGAVLTGSTTAGNSNASATQIVSSGDDTTPTNSTGGGGGGTGGGNRWYNGKYVILESIRDLAEGVNRLASALESSHMVKCEILFVLSTCTSTCTWYCSIRTSSRCYCAYIRFGLVQHMEQTLPLDFTFLSNLCTC